MLQTEAPRDRLLDADELPGLAGWTGAELDRPDPGRGRSLRERRGGASKKGRADREGCREQGFVSHVR